MSPSGFSVKSKMKIKCFNNSSIFKRTSFVILFSLFVPSPTKVWKEIVSFVAKSLNKSVTISIPGCSSACVL